MTKRNSRNDFATLLDGIFNVDLPKFVNELPASKYVPPVNILEKEDQFILEVAVPGVEKEAINVDINDNMLTISRDKAEDKAENENETTVTEGKFTRKEFNFNSFKRTFTLPETVDAHLISATNTNGILSIVLPKKEEAKAVKKTIAIG